MKQPKVAIITSTYNQEELLVKCLKSLKKTNYSNYQIYFIDDSGKGKIGKKIKKNFKEVKVTINKSNLGYSVSNNILIKKAIKNFNPKYILHIDDDTEIIDKDWLKKLVLEGEKDKKTGILGCKVIYSDGSLQWFLKKEKIQFNKINKKIKDEKGTEAIKEISDVIGCCFLIKKEVIDKIGLLDEKFSPAYGEETDLCLRARKAGYRCIYVGKTKIIHHGSSSSKTIESDFIWFIKKRNAIRLELLNHSFFKILKYQFIHFGALFKKDDLKFFKKFKLLIKAYLENWKNREEIKQKRKERNN